MLKGWTAACSELIFKIIVVGNTDVGKSALIRRFIHDSFSAIKSTKPVGAKYKVLYASCCFSITRRGFTGFNVLHSQEEILVNLREPFAIDDMLARLVIVRFN